MAGVKNYNSCPLKKRPIFYEEEKPIEVKDEVTREQFPEQDEPVNLCVKKVMNEEKLPAPIAKLPLQEITANHQTTEYHRNYKEEEACAPRVQCVKPEALYNLLPGYAAANYPHAQPASVSPVRQEQFWPYSREPSLSPPSQTHLYAPMKSIPSPPQHYQPEEYYPHHHHTENVHHKSESHFALNKNRYVPYHVSRQHHIVDQYQSSMSPAHSLNSLGSPRSSMSPASTSSSITDDPYHVHPISKAIGYEQSATGNDHATGRNELPRYQCSDCSKSYSTHSGLTKHKQFHCTAAENNQAKKSFNCEFCEKTYTTMGALKMHIRTHTKPCKCHLCGKAFSRPWLLQGHIRTHTGDKPFSCQYCHRAFADKSNLRAHLQTHSDVKKYSCTSCSKTFSRMSLLTKHNEGGCSGVLSSTSF